MLSQSPGLGSDTAQSRGSNEVCCKLGKNSPKATCSRPRSPVTLRLSLDSDSEVSNAHKALPGLPRKDTSGLTVGIMSKE